MKKAFTTAELLISLVIIGTIAMLVVPTFIKDYNIRVYSTSIKNIYNDIMNAVARACADSNVTRFSETIYSKSGNEMNFMKTYFKGQEGNSFATKYKSLCGTEKDFTPEEDKTFILPSGAALQMKCKNNFVCTIHIDTNGRSGPNIGGLDKFRLDLATRSSSIQQQLSIGGDGQCYGSAAGSQCIQELLRKDWDIERYTNNCDGNEDDDDEYDEY